MPIRYEVYLINKQYQEHIYSLETSIREALHRKKQFDTTFARTSAGYTACIHQEEGGPILTVFSAPAGIDKWLYYTDSHGRPAKRFLTTIVKGELSD